jgi:hypothetical protein
MPNWSRIVVSTAALIVAATAPIATAAETAKHTRKQVSKDESKKKPARTPVEKENSYSARANAQDPSGDFKSYPDWARAAISPKLDD